MRRIAIITSDVGQDWASVELLEAVNALACGSILDPLSFDLRINGEISLSSGDKPLDAYDAFVMRGFNRQGETDYQYEILELLQRAGKLVINSPAALSIAESKAQTTFCLQEAGLPVPRTLVTQSVAAAREALDAFGRCVLKPLYGSHGSDMEIVEPSTADEILPGFFRRYQVIYLQEFVPNGGRDIRAFMVGDEIPAAVYRIARKGQWRTNVAQGSSCAPCEVTPKLREICVEATRLTGLDYTGIDVIEGPDGPMILEVNGAPWWHGLLEATGRNVAYDVIRHILRLLDTGTPARQPAGF